MQLRGTSRTVDAVVVGAGIRVWGNIEENTGKVFDGACATVRWEGVSGYSGKEQGEGE